jgi:hypothetical protein
VTLTPRQIRGIQYKRQRQEREKELESRAQFGAIAGADLAAVYEADRSLVECWMANTGDVYGPGCARRRPRRTSFPYSADREHRCAGCQQSVGDCQASRRRRAR